MKLDQKQVEKMAPLLHNVLKYANGDEVLRAILFITSESRDAEEDHVDNQELDPAQFPSRETYRQALIAQRQSQFDKELNHILQALQDLSLTSRANIISRSVVVEGSAYKILASLNLPDVCYATLDQPL